MLTEPNSQIVWIFGATAAGKKTLIRTLEKDEQHPLRVELALRKNIRVCEESLSWITDHTDETPIRNRLHTIAGELLAPNVSVLLKCQGVDIDASTLQKLKLAAAETTHRIIFLWVDSEELSRRWGRRGIRDPDPARCKSQQEEMLSCVKALQDDFQLMIVDATSKQYVRLTP